MYKLCRTNNTTLARHAKRRHDGNLSEIDVQPYLGSSETVRKARMHCEKHCSKDVLAVVPSSVDPASSTSEEKRLSDELEKSAEVVQPVDAPVPAKKQIGKVQTTLAFEGQAVHGQPVDSLHSKIDTLMKEVKELKLQVNCKKPGPSPLMAVDRISHEETALLLLHWPEVQNILDLVRVCKHVQFFSGDAEHGELSVLRCETCYQYLKKFEGSSSLASSPMAIARKGLGG